MTVVSPQTQLNTAPYAGKSRYTQDRTSPHQSAPVNPEEQKQHIASLFNTVAGGYDSPPLRFFRISAERLVQLADLQPGQRVLDIATGTGLAAIASARAVGSTGLVVGVDLAGEMLAKARKNITDAGLQNIELYQLDAERLSWPDATFDAATAALCIFLMPDPPAALNEWRRVLKPGGKMAVSVFGDDAFQPFSDQYVALLRKHGVPFRSERRPFATQRITHPDQCADLLRNAGFEEVQTFSEQAGYHLASAEEWWEIVWNSGFRGPLARLDAAQLPDVKREHLAEVEAGRTPQGIWVDVSIVYAL